MKKKIGIIIAVFLAVGLGLFFWEGTLFNPMVEKLANQEEINPKVMTADQNPVSQSPQENLEVAGPQDIDVREVVRNLDCDGEISGLQISADGKKVAWIEYLRDENDDDYYWAYAVNIADLDGGNRKSATRQLWNEEELVIDQLVNHDVFYGMHIGALDAPEYLSDLYRLNGETGENEFIFGETQEEHEKRFCGGHKGEFISDVSEGGNLIAYFQDGNLYVRDVKAKKTFPLALPEKGNGFYGVRFSPDGKKVAFAGFEDEDDKNDDASSWSYLTCFYVEDIETHKIKKVETIQQDGEGKPRYYQVEWSSNSTLLIDGKTITLEQ